MKGFRRLLEDYAQRGAEITHFGKFSDICRGQRGIPHFVITTPNGCYEVSVLSHPSTHGRWMIKKTLEGYEYEVRTKNRLIFRPYHTTGTEPEHSKEYRRETRLHRSEYIAPPPDPSYDKQILLIYPEPDSAAYIANGYDELLDGSLVCGREVMYIHPFHRMIETDLGGHDQS